MGSKRRERGVRVIMGSTVPQGPVSLHSGNGHSRCGISLTTPKPWHRPSGPMPVAESSAASTDPAGANPQRSPGCPSKRSWRTAGGATAGGCTCTAVLGRGSPRRGRTAGRCGLRRPNPCPRTASTSCLVRRQAACRTVRTAQRDLRNRSWRGHRPLAHFLSHWGTTLPFHGTHRFAVH
jgi:hypothetical protein